MSNQSVFWPDTSGHDVVYQLIGYEFDLVLAYKTHAASNIPRGRPWNQSKQLLLVLVQMFLVRSQYVHWCASCAIRKENGYCVDAQRSFFVQF